MLKRLCCLLLALSLVACTPANPPQAFDDNSEPQELMIEMRVPES